MGTSGSDVGDATQARTRRSDRSIDDPEFQAHVGPFLAYCEQLRAAEEADPEGARLEAEVIAEQAKRAHAKWERREARKWTMASYQRHLKRLASGGFVAGTGNGGLQVRRLDNVHVAVTPTRCGQRSHPPGRRRAGARGRVRGPTRSDDGPEPPPPPPLGHHAERRR